MIGGYHTALMGVIATGRRGDPFFDDVILLLHGEGTNGGQVFTDSSSYAHVPSVINGSIQTSTAAAKFDSASILANGGYLDWTADAEWLFGSSDFTLECWAYPTTVDATRRSFFSFNFDGSGTGTSWAVDFTSTNFRMQVGSGSSLFTVQTATPPAVNEWAHYAFVRDGTTIRIYVNGVQAASAAGPSGAINDAYLGSRPRLMRRGDASQQFVGYMDEVRFTRACRYPNGTSFTVPIARFPDS